MKLPARLWPARRTLLALLVVSLCGWAFLELADATREGEMHAFDVALLEALRNPADLADPLGPPWVESLARDVTALGGMITLALVTLAVAGYLRLIGRGGSAALVLATVASGMAASLLIKAGFDRPRPDLVPHGVATYTSSFPSAHAMQAAVTYLTLAVLLARVEKSRRVRAYLLAVAILVTVAVGVSRVYLGVHWPTDVLAGWAAGAGWALACLLVADWLQGKGVLRPPPEDGA